MKFVTNVATKAETKVKMQKAEKREMHDRGGLTCQRCVNVTEAERKKRGNVRVTEEYYRGRGGNRGKRNVRGTEECYHVRGGCMLQALRVTSRSAALGRGVPSEGRTDAAPRGPVPGVCLRACTVEVVRMVEVANFQLEARTKMTGRCAVAG